MTDKIDDGGQAFPAAIAVGPSGDVYPGFEGMSLRDWFAGQVLAGLIATNTFPGGSDFHEDYAETAYHMADAMLAERSKDRGEQQ